MFTYTVKREELQELLVDCCHRICNDLIEEIVARCEVQGEDRLLKKDYLEHLQLRCNSALSNLPSYVLTSLQNKADKILMDLEEKS